MVRKCKNDNQTKNVDAEEDTKQTDAQQQQPTPQQSERADVEMETETTSKQQIPESHTTAMTFATPPRQQRPSTVPQTPKPTTASSTSKKTNNTSGTIKSGRGGNTHMQITYITVCCSVRILKINTQVGRQSIRVHACGDNQRRNRESRSNQRQKEGGIRTTRCPSLHSHTTRIRLLGSACLCWSAQY